MTANKFIFSNKPVDWLKRHVVFWVVAWAWMSVSHLAQPMGKSIAVFEYPVYAILESILFVLSSVPIVYLLLYVVFPKLVYKKRYVASVLVILTLWWTGGIIFKYLFSEGIPVLLSNLPDEYVNTRKRTEEMNFFLAVTWMLKGVFSISCIAMAIKFGKQWYLKEQRNNQLQKENTEAQLQLLTAQVHPHFLFNTLNNIYSQAQYESPKSSTMIMGLSDMLRYILYEGRKPLVPLDKELQMVLEYMKLEQVRYGNKLDLHYDITDNTNNLYIAPLLLLPFIENCFKHGTSNMLEEPWISLTIQVQDETMVMKLMNGKASVDERKIEKGGIGIKNVMQRLYLLYEKKHVLQIREEENVYVVDLSIELTRTDTTLPLAMPAASSQAYA